MVRPALLLSGAHKPAQGGVGEARSTPTGAAKNEIDVPSAGRPRDRPKGRPRGGVERSETAVSELMAETEGFEPSIPFWGMLI